MSLIEASHDSLPYIDTDIPPSDRASINSLITSSVPPAHTSTPHPYLPPLPSSNFTPMIQLELDRHSRSEPLVGGIDTSRYEALDPPPTSPTSDEDKHDVLKAWRETLRKAYTSSSHLRTRLTNLSLLEEFGKNAWLIHNSQLEDILRSLEREVVSTAGEVEAVNQERKAAQEGVRGEMEGLEEAWRGGVGKVIEVEVAGEGVREEILGRRREGAR
ncbi:MAG: hypothetical protein M1836_002663 [Candelina mexicana]|nr:MAG: hypothetical protein M1836_002663 [Candelina mexicana]